MKKLNAAVTATLAAALLTAGCGPQEQLLLPPDSAETERAIVNGKTYNGHPSVGRLIRKVGSHGASCTATLIGKRHVLTAGHCVSPGGTHVFYIGGGSYQTNQVARHYKYSSTSTGGAQYDIALLKLNSEPPVTPSIIAKQAPKVGQKLTIIGYGITATGRKDSGTKRIGYNTVHQVTSTIFTFSGASGSESNTCSGDSGGPAFAVEDGREVHLGIHSMASRPCGSRGINTRTDAFNAWIHQQSGGDVYEPPKDKEPPTVAFTSPANGAAVRQSFEVKVAPKDDQTVANVEIFVGDKSAGLKPGAAEVDFYLSNIPVGTHTLKAVATDGAGNKGEAKIQVTVVPPKDYGAQCSEHMDCKSVLCAGLPGVATRFCSRLCDANNNTCPSDAACLPVAGANLFLCSLPDSALPGGGDDGEVEGSCSVAGESDPVGVVFLTMFGLLLLVRRRR